MLAKDSWYYIVALERFSEFYDHRKSISEKVNTWTFLMERFSEFYEHRKNISEEVNTWTFVMERFSEFYDSRKVFLKKWKLGFVIIPLEKNIEGFVIWFLLVAAPVIEPPS